MVPKYVCAGLAVLGLPLAAEARPVSYPGGWTAIQSNTGEASSLLVHYSPTAADALGLYTTRDWYRDLTFTGLQYTRLVKRWNGPASQANLYASLGAGAADAFGDDGADAAGFVGVMADWETRRWFTGYEARIDNFAPEGDFRQSFHAGFAPYLGDSGDLHTWLMVDVMHTPDAAEPVRVTPMVRLFKGVQMIELGYTLEQDTYMMNWIVRF